MAEYRMTEWVKNNRKRWNEYQSDYRKSNTDKKYLALFGLTYTEWKSLSIRPQFSKMWDYYRRRAKETNILFELDKNDFLLLITQPCFYCGNLNDEKGLNGIDRVDNDLDYIWGNCVPCCTACNRLKSNLSFDQFIEAIGNIAKHFNIVSIQKTLW